MEKENDKRMKKDLEDKYRNMNCRMYEKKYPETNDLVMCQIKETFDDGAYVELLEYNNIKGLILNSEISRKRVKHVKKIIKEGREEVLRVIRVDKEQGYIDLTKKTVKHDEIQEFSEEYLKSKTVHLIMKNLSVETDIEMEELYQQFGWPLAKIYGNIHDAFKLMLSNPDEVFSKIEIDENVKNALIDILKIRMVPQPIKIKADFKLTCFHYDGIDAIKAALMEGEKLSTEEIPIKFKFNAAPLYDVVTVTTKSSEAIKLLGEALKIVENSIKLRGGNFILNKKPSIVGENTEKKELEEQINALRRGNIPEEEDEEHEEGIKADIEGGNDFDDYNKKDVDSD